MKEGVEKEIKKEVPALVNILAVLNIIGSVLLILIGIFLIIVKFTSIAEPKVMPNGGISFSLLSMFSQTFLTLGLIFLPLGIFNLFVSIYLRKGRKWARICMIVLAAVGVIVSIISSIMGSDIVSNILSLIMSGLIGGYLLFNKEVKEVFR